MPVSSDHNKSIRLYGTYPIVFDSYTKFNTTDAVKLPTGTTAQRPATANQGDIRYNSTTLFAEVYNGSTWEAVGGGPFDATGGNKIIAPDAVATAPTSATFTSADGESVVVTSAGHSVIPGQVVQIVTSVTGYSGKWTVVSANTNDFTFVMTTVAAPNSGSCTYKKSGNFKVHIFTSSGTFTAGTKASNVEVLVVGGGGGGYGYNGNGICGGGGGGAVVYCSHYSISANQTISVTVGAGGTGGTYTTPASNGGASVFSTITAGGGYAGSTEGGASGVGYPNCPSNTVPFGIKCGAGAGGSPEMIKPSNIEQQSAGLGKYSTISGLPTAYGGGGGSQYNVPNERVLPGFGRDGGATFVTVGSTTPFRDAIANSGGGGYGLYGSGVQGTNGASGIVIVRYPYWV
jgi:hypothetical protein